MTRSDAGGGAKVFRFKVLESDLMKSRIFITLSILLITSSLFSQTDPYSGRRAQIFEEVGENLVIIKNSGRDYVLSIDVNWNYYFLTGDQTAGAILVMDGKNKTSVIYREQPQYGSSLKDIDGLKSKPLADFENDLTRNLFRTKTLWIDFSAMLNLENFGRRMGSLEGIRNITPAIHNMRKIKDEHEMELLRYAIETTAAGLVEVMKAAEPGMNEKDFDLILKYKFQKAGCENLGFNIQAASGPNSTYVHYGNNDRQTEEGDMMVFDVGARYGFYSADISRSFPVSGKFTKEQKEIYNLVLKAQKAAIILMKPGQKIQIASNKAMEVLNKGLFELGLLTDLDKSWQNRFWIQHGFFHHIGLVVHDVGGYGGEMAPGMIITMEPGLYFPADYLETASRRQARNVDEAEIQAFLETVKPIFEKYINIGVRIEDDVYITMDGNRVISSGVPKEVHEIEEIMAQSSFFNRE